MELKDALSRAGQPVYVVINSSTKPVQGCTITSLVSTNIDSPNQQLLFVVQKDSHFRSEIDSQSELTINLLNVSQIEIAQFFSSKRKFDEKEITINYIEEFNETVIIRDCLLVYNVVIDNIIDLEKTSVVVNRLIKPIFSTSGVPLLYGNRKYGKFIANDIYQ